MTSNVGKWNRWYGLLGNSPEPYGDSPSYALAAEWLADCDLVEDWGCGKGWMRHHIPAERYRGIDGSVSPFADQIVDLATYRSNVPGIVLRHVLEHDYRWADILDNAVTSYTRRLVLVLFTPPEDTTREIAFNVDPGVPDLTFAKWDLTSRFGEAQWHSETIPSPTTQYGVETIYYLEKPR